MDLSHFFLLLPLLKPQASWDLAGISSQVVVQLPSVLAQEGSVHHSVPGSPIMGLAQLLESFLWRSDTDVA